MYCCMLLAARAHTQPINILFTFLQKHTKVVIWLYDNTEIRLEGYIIVRWVEAVGRRPWSWRADAQGFDEFMNVVIDETIQHYQPKKDGSKAVKASEELGRILLKGELDSARGELWSVEDLLHSWGHRDCRHGGAQERRAGLYRKATVLCAVGAVAMVSQKAGESRTARFAPIPLHACCDEGELRSLTAGDNITLVQPAQA